MLSPPQALVLNFLDVEGPTKEFQINKRTGIGLERLRGTVRNLEERRFIVQQEDELGTPKWFLTEEGEKALDKQGFNIAKALRK